MKWITREHAKVDRIACPWLIRKYVDVDAKFLYVPAGQVLAIAEREGAIPYDVPDVELGHHNGKCSFEAIVEKYSITDPAIRLLADIVHAADVSQDQSTRPEGAGLVAVAEGFRHLGYADDQQMLAAESIVYDALYAYCQAQVNRVTTE